MAEKKPSYTDLVYQVVREASEPLPFAEIMQRVASILPITTGKPKGTIRNAISQSRLIVNTGDGRYGWKYRVINGSVLRLSLSDSDISQHKITFPEELRDALWPAFFENQKHADRSPVQIQLPEGKISELTLDYFGEGKWGTRGSPDFWEWLKSVDLQPGDNLIFRVIDGEERRYSAEFQPHARRDEEAIATRNQQMVQAALACMQRNRFIAAIWELSPLLLASGQYKYPVSPDPLEDILKDLLWGPDLPEMPASTQWLVGQKLPTDPLVSSLLDQIGEFSHRRGSKKEAVNTTTPNQIYQLKVSLRGISPQVWRRIQVPGNISLPQLHAVLQISMGWTNSHLHGFTVNGKFYTEPNPDYGEGELYDEFQVRLSQIAPEVGSHFVYEYDFGDSWDHLLVVEQIVAPDPNMQYPVCLDGERACPPDDVGGVGGYMEFLAVIRDRKNPDRAGWLQWAGGKFDPEMIDLHKTNELLRLLQSNLR